ncbi:AsmA family protein [Marinobacter sp. C2H3]|uniref:AsmA family protein n=1 Tax=Marinobacter sp. C2H3 TaxID=3119003 RepID=UPI00300F16B9
MKALRYALIAIVALVLLLVAAVVIATAVIDPNDYKPQIKQAVESNTNLKLDLNGDIGWSFFPLGLDVNDVQATLDGQRLVALKQLVAQVDLWSLISLSPQVSTFVLNGLDANLVMDKQGQGNWTRIMPEPKAGDQAATKGADSKPEQAPAEQAKETAGGGTPLNFNVDSVQIGDARVHYEDKRSGQSVTLTNVTVNASDITLGSEFPLDIAFKVETAKPQLAVDGSISARLAADQALKQFAVSGLKATFDMNGEPFGGKSVTAELSGSAKANLNDETAALSGFSASLANLSLTTDLQVKGFGDKPAVNGKIAIADFSLKELLSNLGQKAVPTADPDVLKSLAFSTNLGGSPGKVALSDLTLKLDDTTFKGSGSYTLANSGIVFNLQGDSLNADRYLPPKAEGDAAAQPATDGEKSAPATASNAPESDLLPLDTLRTLLLDVKFGLGKLIVSNLTLNDIKAASTAKDGLVKLDEFSGKLYEGGFKADATLDARKNTPDWAFNAAVSNVQTLPLLTDLAEVDMLSGGANININATSRGNRISALRENADGKITFNLAKGEFRKMNLTHMACQGIALVNQDKLTTTDWGTTTPFNDMSGTLDINGNTLNNTSLVAALAGMKLEGNGSVDLKKTALDYEAGLRIVGEVHRDPACRVTEYVQNVVIPVECRGDFTKDAAKLCSFDGSRFRDTLKTIAENAAKAKVKKEVDKAKEKAKEKVQEKVQEKLGDKLKGLFNQ